MNGGQCKESFGYGKCNIQIYVHASHQLVLLELVIFLTGDAWATPFCKV